MTVFELITLLETQDPTLTVVVPGHDEMMYPTRCYIDTDLAHGDLTVVCISD